MDRDLRRSGALRRAVVAGALALAPRADAAGCEPLDEPGFDQAVAATTAALAADDPVAHAAASADLRARLACLTFVPSPRRWAEYLVGVAAVAYVDGGDWQAPLETALRVAPEIDRAVGPTHEIAQWSVPPPPPSLGPVPAGLGLYVDGVAATELPAAAGLHLVQLRRGTELSSALLVDAPVPAGWLTVGSEDAPPVAPAAPAHAGRPELAAAVGLAGGASRFVQRVDRPDAFAGDVTTTEPGAGVGVSALARVGAAGAALHLDGRAGGHGPPAIDGSAAATVGSRHGSVGIGVAGATAPIVERGQARTVWLVAPSVSGAARLPFADARATAGWLPALTYAEAEIGASLPRTERLRPRIALEGRLVEARFVQVSSGRALSSIDLAALASVGLATGAW